MRSAETILGIIHERGKKGLPLERVYRLLFNRDLYLMAYGKIYRNDGATTPGSTSGTLSVDTDAACLHREKELDEETPTFDAHMVGQTASRGHSTDLGKLL